MEAADETEAAEETEATDETEADEETEAAEETEESSGGYLSCGPIPNARMSYLGPLERSAE